jgi:hypothetical protein
MLYLIKYKAQITLKSFDSFDLEIVSMQRAKGRESYLIQSLQKNKRKFEEKKATVRLIEIDSYFNPK